MYLTDWHHGIFAARLMNERLSAALFDLEGQLFLAEGWSPQSPVGKVGVGYVR